MPNTFREQYADYASDCLYHLAKEALNHHCALHWMMVLNPQRILEVGAGSGKTAVLAKRLLPEAQVIAIDVDYDTCKNIARFVDRSAAGVEVACCDGLRLPFKDQSFDLSYSCGVVEHLGVEGMQQCLREQLRVASIGLVEVPLAHWFIKGLSSQGDELVMPKSVWMRFLLRIGSLIEISFLGPPGEEEVLLALLTANDTAVLPLSPENYVHYKFGSEGYSFRFDREKGPL